MNEEENKVSPNAQAGVKLDFSRAVARAGELWRGDVPLVRCFWIYFFAASFVLSFLSNSFNGAPGSLFHLLSVAWMGFMVMPVVRAAGKFDGDPMWSVLARVAAILAAVGVAASVPAILF
ncbi:MAG: hypothetical protein EOM26_00235 [Alphaproteobacteria bacterium]|nr:hypothetical protein [Alphaproteobacteria bacterium]